MELQSLRRASLSLHGFHGNVGPVGGSLTVSLSDEHRALGQLGVTSGPRAIELSQGMVLIWQTAGNHG
ncbi:hypothetical protein GJAV_G00269700 [Gymnothorax javanicus]|nr:hypothetical protein GJAV_G00269700 [Gymnothorax javanicus]